MADKPSDSKITHTPQVPEGAHPVSVSVTPVDHHEAMNGQAKQIAKAGEHYLAGGILPTIEAPKPLNKDNRAGTPGDEGTNHKAGTTLPTFDPIESSGSKAPRSDKTTPAQPQEGPGLKAPTRDHIFPTTPAPLDRPKILTVPDQNWEQPTTKPLKEPLSGTPKWNPIGTGPFEGDKEFKPSSRWQADPKMDPTITGPFEGPTIKPLIEPGFKPDIPKWTGTGPIEGDPGFKPLPKWQPDSKWDPTGTGPLEGPTIKPLIEPAIKLPPDLKIPQFDKQLPPFVKTPNWPAGIDPKTLMFDEKE